MMGNDEMTEGMKYCINCGTYFGYPGNCANCDYPGVIYTPSEDNTTLKVKSYNGGSIIFRTIDKDILVFKSDGDVIIRDEKVDNNQLIYEAIKEFLTNSSELYNRVVKAENKIRDITNNVEKWKQELSGKKIYCRKCGGRLMVLGPKN